MNVVMIVTDQQRHDTIRNSNFHTPNLTKLRKESVTCNATYAQSPQCQPSRASMFTGRYPTAHKVWWNSIQLPRTEKTIGNYLQSAGYHTGYVGKLHFSEKKDESHLATHFGFDTTFLTHDWHRFCAKNKKATVVSEYYDILRTQKWYGQLQQKEWQHDEIVAQKAIEFLNKTKSPFFLVVSYNAPHPPYAAPKPYSKTYEHVEFSGPANSQTYDGTPLTQDDWQAIKAQYYGCVSWADNNIGKIIDSVNLENTMIVFTSDHGDMLGDHGYFSKGPFAYEGNTRVPLLMHLPGVQPIIYNHVVQHIDILPTMLDYLGMEIPKAVQGKSLLAGFREKKKVNKFALSMIGHDPRLRMIRYKQYKYWMYGDEEKCFDLAADPQENTNLTDKQLLDEMRFILLQALIEAEDPLPFPES